MFEMKKCVRCNKTKFLFQFYKDKKSSDGHRSWCKDCLIKYNQKCKERNNLKTKEYNKRYYSKNRERSLAYATDYRERNQQRLEAHKAVQRALTSGELIRPEKCSNPFCKGVGESTIEAHHESYAKKHWLDVIWLCPSCHKLVHGEV